MAPLVSKTIRTAVIAFLAKDGEEHLALVPQTPSSSRLMALTARKPDLKFLLCLRYSSSGVNVTARHAVDKIERIEVSEDVLHIYKKSGTENQYPFSSQDALRSFVSNIREMTALAITDENNSLPLVTSKVSDSKDKEADTADVCPRTETGSTDSAVTCVSSQDLDSESKFGVLKSDEFSLLDMSRIHISTGTGHAIDTAPLLTHHVYHEVIEEGQYGVLGHVLAVQDDSPLRDPRLYVNTNAPLSVVICGVQGSGKSHTTSAMLENMLISHGPIGHLAKPLSALVLHLGEGGSAASACEAAWIGVSSLDVTLPQVKVFVSPSCIETMKRVYGAVSKKIVVEPLYFEESELDAQSFKARLGISLTEGNPPLYVQIILSILRSLGENFSFSGFETLLDERKRDFNPTQLAGLDQRMWLLKSFMRPRTSFTTRKSSPSVSKFAGGQMTIVDLSDPFMDTTSACGIFEILVRLFVRSSVNSGKVLVVDEAHKYLGKGSSVLTNQLESLVRQQRHLALRVILSTQEPTVIPPVLLDLCPVVIAHRFSSPAWWDHLRKHVSAKVSEEEGFDAVVRLDAGEAILLAPSALIDSAADDESGKGSRAVPLGRQFMRIKTRRRITADGGASVLVVGSKVGK